MKQIKIIIMIIVLISLVLASGCWSRHELNEIGIITAAGADICVEKEDDIKFIYQIVNPSTMSKAISSMKTPFITEVSNGETISEAIVKADRETPRKLYFGHLQVFIISSNYAEKNGIRSIIDYLYRNNNIRENIFLLVSDDQPVELVLSTQVSLENLNGVAIQKILKNAHSNEGIVKPTELREIVNSLINETSSLVVPLIKISPEIMNSKLDTTQDANKKIAIKIEGYGIFKDDKLIGKLNANEGRALNFIRDDIENAVVVIEYKNAKHSVELLNSKTKIETEIKNGRPEILIEINNTGDLASFTLPEKLDSIETINQLEDEVDKEIKREVEQLITKIQSEYKLDIFKFGEKIAANHPKEWEEIIDSWEDEYLSDLKVEIKVNTCIKRIGMKMNTIIK